MELPPDEATRDPRLTVLYDADCAFCRRIAARLAGADRLGRLRLVPAQRAQHDRPEVRELAQRRDLLASLHVIEPDGRWAAGGEAALRAMERVPSLAPLAHLARLPLVADFVEPGYAWVARHRRYLRWLAGPFGRQRPRRGRPCCGSAG